MDLAYNPSEVRLLFAPEFLHSVPGRGRPLRLPHLGLVFYGVTDCLFAAAEWQTLLPVMEGGLPYIFKESGPFVSNEHRMPGMAADALNGKGVLAAPKIGKALPVRTIEEAAPFAPPGYDNLWHWMLESLPKLLALESIGYNGYYIVPKGISFVDESLDILGIDPARLLPAQALYRVKRMLIPPRQDGYVLAENLPLIGLLRHRLEESLGLLPGSRRVYIKRIGRRRIINGDLFEDLMREFGFETMIPEELSLREQLLFMSNAECSIMPHGANTTLTIMQKPRSTFIELFGNRYICYSNLATIRLLKLRYHSQVVELNVSQAPQDNPSYRDYFLNGIPADILVDLIHTRILLENALG